MHCHVLPCVTMYYHVLSCINMCYNIARKFNSASMLHILIEHADDVNKLFAIPQVVNVNLAILSLLSAFISQQYR